MNIDRAGTKEIGRPCLEIVIAVPIWWARLAYRLGRPMKSIQHPDYVQWKCLAVALLVAIVAAAPLASDAEARPKRLSAGEAEALLSGNTVFGFNPSDDSTYTMFHSGNGRVRAELRNINGDMSESDGDWWVNDQGLLCVEWDNYSWINSCAAVVQDNDTITFEDENGRIVSFGEVAPGNPDDI